MKNGRIRVLIVDDSTLMREAIRAILNQDPSFEVVGMAKDGKDAVEKALAIKPDVITMDLRMPVMSGLEAIEKIMEDSPVPIIVVSSMDINVIVKALSIGAMDFVAVAADIDTIASDLIAKLKIASHVKAVRRFKVKPCIIKTTNPLGKSRVAKVVAIGVSTGGPQALQEILSKIPIDFHAGLLVVQHMSKGFIEGLAEWLNVTSCLHVKVAEAGDILKNGMIMLAPDDYHMRIDEDAKIILSENTNKSIIHIPSIDIMMKSAAESFGENVIGVIMTGMGSDGVEGMKAIRKAGGRTIAQDEKSSVVFGMNKIAIDSGCIERVAPLSQLSDELVKMV